MTTKRKKRVRADVRRRVFSVVLSFILAALCVFSFTPLDERIEQGLDVQGGLSVVLQAKPTDGETVSAETMEKARSIIESRVNALGTSEAVVAVQGDDQILVEIPGEQDADEVLNSIGKTGYLEFASVDSITDETVKSAIENGSYVTQDTYTDEFGNSLPAGTVSYQSIESGTYTPVITGENIDSVSVGPANDLSTEYAVNLKLDSEGTTAFGELTQQLVSTNGQIAIILDGEVQSAPAVQAAITDGNVSITGGYTLDEAKAMETILESGSLPVSFEYLQSEIVGPTLGQNALFNGAMVALAGLLIVMVYLLGFYRGMGTITAVSMVLFAVFYLGILAILSHFGLFSLSMAGIAGIVLTIGMAADSSILVLERFREEIRMGRSVRAASISGVKHGIQTSIDADLVTLISAVVLFLVATSSVKGFGLTLALGIICDIVVMLLFKAPLIRLLAPKSIAKHPKFWGIEDCVSAAETENIDDVHGRFIKRDINIIGHVKVFGGIAAACMVVVALAVGILGVSFGVEFTGGTSVSIRDANGTSIEQVESAFNDAGMGDVNIRTTESDGVSGYVIDSSDTDIESANSKAYSAAETLGIDSSSVEVTTIGPAWGSTVIQSSLFAFFLSLAIIIVYIAFRFGDYKMGLCAIVALIHDLIIVVGVYTLFGRDITPNTIAALLTILGYSLYDTIVVFHRIVEAMRDSDKKVTFATMANHSVNEVFVRSLNTTITSLIPVVAMLIFGGEGLFDFALAMTIGLVCGCYSSYAIATTLYVAWKSREEKYAKLKKKLGSGIELLPFR